MCQSFSDWNVSHFLSGPSQHRNCASASGWVSARIGSYRNRSRQSPVHFCFWQSWGPWGGCSWSGSPFSSESHCSEIQDQRKVQYPHGFPMKRFVKCFFELLTQIIVKVRKCKVQRVCVLHFQLAGSGGCFFLMKLYH